MVAEKSSLLCQGMYVVKKKNGKNQEKYNIAFDGLQPCFVEVFIDKKSLSED
jgi:hypothetical protein